MMDEVPKIFEAVFECTLQMITVNFEDYPDHRLKFFALLRAITNHCFRALFTLDPSQLKLVVDSIVWAFHSHRAQHRRDRAQPAAGGFSRFPSFATSSTSPSGRKPRHEVAWAVMTDGFQNFGLQTARAASAELVFTIAESDQVSATSVDAAKPAYPNNARFRQGARRQPLDNVVPEHDKRGGGQCWCRACSTTKRT